MKNQTKKSILGVSGGIVILLALLFNLQLSTGVQGLNSGVVSLQEVQAFADTGTCCKQTDAECIVGDVTREDKYYIAEGPCPE